MTVGATPQTAAPYFEDLEPGQVERGAPALTLTAGHAGLHQAVLGNRLWLALDAGLSAAVAGGEPIASPGLVWDVAIGQSTLLTQRVVANLFYRGLCFHRAPRIGDTLRTVTTVEALRQNRPRPGRAATGMAVLRIETTDQKGRPVLDFRRCAMLPLRDPEGETGRGDDLEAAGSASVPQRFGAAVAGWDLAAFRDHVPGRHFADLEAGEAWAIAGGDVVSAAPELVRLTLNVATTHHDRAAAPRGERLVYGGHTIGLAATQLLRALPNLVTIVAWHSCDHLAPVLEGDTLRSEIEVERAEPLDGGGGLVHLRSRVGAGGERGRDQVLDWRLVAVMA